MALLPYFMLRYLSMKYLEHVKAVLWRAEMVLSLSIIGTCPADRIISMHDFIPLVCFPPFVSITGCNISCRQDCK